MACAFCNAAMTVKAHLIPKSIVQQVDGAKNNYAHVPADGTGRFLKRPAGQYDSQLLCGDCDNRIGRYEAHLLQLLKSAMTAAAKGAQPIGLVTNDAARQWQRGLLGIIYKFTKTRPNLGGLDIGPYGGLFEDIVLRSSPIPGFVKFSAEHIYTDLGPGDPTYNRDPFPERIDGVRFVGLTLMNVCWRVKIDKRTCQPPFGEWSTESHVTIPVKHWSDSREGLKLWSMYGRSDLRRYLS